MLISVDFFIQLQESECLTKLIFAINRKARRQPGKSMKFLTMTNLITSYQVDKSNLLAPDIHLVIGTRHKPEASKPKNYLLRRFPGNQHQYISSLYPTPKNEQGGSNQPENWLFDYQGVSYRLSIDRAACKAEIVLVHSTVSINNVELGLNSNPPCQIANLKNQRDAAA